MGFERQLINSVRERKCLYQTKSRSNRNNRERLNEWHRVSAALRKPVIECRQRWRSLRDRFVREKKKLDLGEISPKCEQQWEYYNELKFLIPSVKPRRSKKERDDPKGAKIYLNRELSDNFANISNSRDESTPAPMAYGHCSLDEMFDTETTMLQEFNDESKPNDAMNEELMSDEENFEDEEQKFSIHQNQSLALEHTKDEEWIEDDFDKYPIIKISHNPSSNEDQHLFKTLENIPSISRSGGSEEPVTTTTDTDPTGSFVDLMNSLKAEISKVLVEEKDENDLFLECMAKKMKKLSPRAKFKIQTNLLANINEELLKEIGD